MTDKVLKDKCRMIATDYEVRQLDEYGDAQDISSFDDRQEALAFAYKSGDWDAVVVEKVIRKYPFHYWKEPVTSTVIYTAGNKDALVAGGWI